MSIGVGSALVGRHRKPPSTHGPRLAAKLRKYLRGGTHSASSRHPMPAAVSVGTCFANSRHSEERSDQESLFLFD